MTDPWLMGIGLGVAVLGICIVRMDAPLFMYLLAVLLVVHAVIVWSRVAYVMRRDAATDADSAERQEE